ncbi:transposase IS4 family protein [Moorella thermoacetica Y72]|uniref:Transposase IS4 family protein n=1 Tax=Moorella thermoacetica Y72 TaxID=1325331 RepID=A0A0S6UCQ1_NEOTH|nr:transposase IS4 family protein [Moorella thermoacetica Y72]
MEGYCVNTELRAGKQHCQKGTPEFLRQAITFARAIT